MQCHSHTLAPVILIWCSAIVMCHSHTLAAVIPIECRMIASTTNSLLTECCPVNTMIILIECRTIVTCHSHTSTYWLNIVTLLYVIALGMPPPPPHPPHLTPASPPPPVSQLEKRFHSAFQVLSLSSRLPFPSPPPPPLFHRSLPNRLPFMGTDYAVKYDILASCERSDEAFK